MRNLSKFLFYAVAFFMIACNPKPGKIVAENQTVKTNQGTSVSITLSVTGGNQETLTYTLGTPTNGTVTGTPPNITYTPAANYVGIDKFTYSATDGKLTSNTAEISVEVAALPLTANNQQLQTPKNTPVSITLTVSGAGQQSLTYQVGTPGNGTLTGTAPNLTYTPTLDYIGPDDFTFSASDGSIDSNTGVISIDVITPIFPLRLIGVTPEEVSITLNANKPAGATTAAVTITAYDADFANEGELIINGNTPIPLFGADGLAKNSDKSVDIVRNVPASHWNDGANVLIFRHTATSGYLIENVTVAFQ